MRAATLALLSLSLLCSCSRHYFRYETQLHADGRIDRALYQHSAATSESARAAGVWNEVVTGKMVEPGDWKGTVYEHIEVMRAEQEREGEGAFVAMTGRFDSVAALPATLAIASLSGERSAGLERSYHRRDWGLVVEHRWEEVLTDTISLAGIGVARDELIDSLVADSRAVMARIVGPEHDASRLIEWLDVDGRAWLAELGDAINEYLLTGLGERGEADLLRELERICSRHGLDLPAGASLVSEDAFATALDGFARSKLETLIRSADGGDPDPELIASLMRALGGIGGMREGEEETAPETNWEAESQAVLFERHGGEEQLKAHYVALLDRVFGSHVLALQPRRFDFEMRVPGFIVETSGVLLGDDCVRWSFQNEDAFLLGYRMSCRSLAPAVALQEQLFGRVVLGDRERLILYLGLVEDHPDLLAVLVSCAREGKRDPLDVFLEELEERSDDRALELHRKLHELF